MLDNQTLRITKNSGEMVEYKGVICTSREEAASLLHPDYWDKIPVGYMRVFNNRDVKLIRISENTMLIRVNGSRNFVQVGS